MKTAFYPLYCADKQSKGRGCFVWSDHAALCLEVINLWEVLPLTRQHRPPLHTGPFFFFFVELDHPRVPLSPQTTQTRKENNGGAGKTADGAICATCHSSAKIRLNNDRVSLLHSRLRQEVGLFFSILGSNLAATSGDWIGNKHLLAICPLQLYAPT